MYKLAGKIAKALAGGKATVLVTVISGKGSAPRHGGSQMLISREGLAGGTIGGGAVEAHGIEKAQTLLGKDKCFVEDLALKQDLGMACGGAATLLYTPICPDDKEWQGVINEILHCFDRRIEANLLLSCGETGAFPGKSAVALVGVDGRMLAGSSEAASCAGLLSSSSKRGIVNGYFSMPVSLPTRAVVFGGGHVGRATVEALAKVGFVCTLFDNRPEFAVSERFPLAERVVCGSYQDIEASLMLEKDDFVLIMTSGHESDFAVLEQVLRQPLAYIGLMGSRHKIAEGRKRMRALGIPDAVFNTVHAPIGLDIQAETPEEIAVSIAAECILQRATL